MSKKKTLPEEFNQLELLDELCNDEIDQYISITSRGDGKSFTLQQKMRELLKEQKSDDTDIDIDDFPF